MTFNELRKATRYSLKEFSDYYNIPYRTIHNWDSGKREPPGYVIELMIYKLIKENRLREEV